MAILNVEAKTPFGQVRHIGVAISGSEHQRHTGILFQFEDRPVRLLHLAFHHHLKNDLPDNTFGWVECDALSDDEAHDFAMWINEVWVQNGERVPYSINYWKGAHFSSEGRFVQSAEGDGLTCATFVMALFENFGWQLLDTANWPFRKGDEKFQEKIVEGLSNPRWVPQTAENKRHRAAQVEFIGNAARFRPEEVTAASGDWDRVPIAQVDAEKSGEDVLTQMRAAGIMHA